MMPTYIFPYQAADASPLTAERLLRALGVTRKHKGFRYAEYMIEAVADDADRLRLITKCLRCNSVRGGTQSSDLGQGLLEEEGSHHAESHCWH